MTELYDVAAIGNAIVDVIAPATDDFLSANALDKGAMMLIDEARGVELYGKMAAGIEASGGSAGNTIAGVASFGGALREARRERTARAGEVHVPAPEAVGAPGELVTR